jgi:hypothetical protein
MCQYSSVAFAVVHPVGHQVGHQRAAWLLSNGTTGVERLDVGPALVRGTGRR